MEIENIGLRHHITVDAKTYQRVTYLLDQKYDKEFTAFCHAEKRADGEYHIFDAFFPKQINTGTTTECDSIDVIELMKEGFDISKGAGHMHSHVNMGVFASGTDKNDILERAKDSGFNAAIIMNKKGEIFGHIADMDLGIYIKKCPVYIDYPFYDSEFEDNQIKKIHATTDLKLIAEIIKEDMYDYMEENYPLTKEETDFLDDVIKNRFKSAVTTQKKSTSLNIIHNQPKGLNKEYDYYNDDDYDAAIDAYYNNSYNKEIALSLEADLEEREDGYPVRAEDWFDEDEWKIIQESQFKSVMSLTELEHIILDEFETLYPGYAVAPF